MKYSFSTEDKRKLNQFGNGYILGKNLGLEIRIHHVERLKNQTAPDNEDIEIRRGVVTGELHRDGQ